MLAATVRFWHNPYKVLRGCRPRAVPIFPLEFVEPRKDIAKTGARNPVQGKTRIPRAGFRDVFPRLDELKRKNRDCSKYSGGVPHIQTIVHVSAWKSIFLYHHDISD